MHSPEGSLPGGIRQEHIDVLNSVDLHIYAGSHASSRYHPRIGYYFNAFDRDYARAVAFTEGLDPRNGDTLAVEGYGQEHLILPAEYQQGIQKILARSPIAKQIASNDTEAMFTEARAIRACDPFNYAAGLFAVRHSVAVVRADANAQEREDWQEVLAGKSMWKRLIAAEANAESLYREARMVRRLGDIALDMRLQNEQIPSTLGFMVDSAHANTLVWRLRTYGISFKRTVGNRLGTNLPGTALGGAILAATAAPFLPVILERKRRS